jgi:DNA-binding CsgD family transcriptional regulator
MTPNQRRRPGRPRREELSERQRRVLDLLVEGKTNSEIADQLGISLDGAKYHVREICDRVGVDTREEAAEWWRQQRGLRARFEVLSEWKRIPRPVRWAGIAGAAALGCAAVVAVLLFAFRDDGEAGPESGVWLALVVPVERTSDDSSQLGQIRAINTRTGEQIDIGEPGSWHNLRWSPAGDRLYGVEAWQRTEDDTVIRMAVFDVRSQELISMTEWTLFDQCECFPIDARWSPDGTRIAIPAGSWAGVLTPDGQLAGQLLGPPEVTTTSGAISWAPDSSRYSYVHSVAAVSVVDRDGQAMLTMLPTDNWWPAELQGPQFHRQLARADWLSADELSVVGATYPWDPVKDEPIDEPFTAWRLNGRLDAAGSAIAWQSVEELAEDEVNAIIDPPAARELRENHGLGGDPPWINMSPDRQFAGGASRLSPSSGFGTAPSPVSYFVTIVDGERFTYPLGEPGRGLRPAGLGVVGHGPRPVATGCRDAQRGHPAATAAVTPPTCWT